MEFTGDYVIPASRDDVWKALNDPAVLQQCIPGCESMEKENEATFNAAVTARIGPVKAKFEGTVTLEDLTPPESYTIICQGKGGAAGFARGSAKVALAVAESGTRLSYIAEAHVGGKLEQIGALLIQGTASKYADDFFATFSSIVTGSAAASTATPVPASAEPVATLADEPDRVTLLEGQVEAMTERMRSLEEQVHNLQSRINPWIWASTLIVVVALLISVFD